MALLNEAETIQNPSVKEVKSSDQLRTRYWAVILKQNAYDNPDATDTASPTARVRANQKLSAPASAARHTYRLDTANAISVAPAKYRGFGKTFES